MNHPSNPGKPGTSASPHADIHQALAAQPAWIQSELAELKKHEKTVLRALEDPEAHALFLRDPAALLGKLKVPVSGALRARMRDDQTLAEAAKPICVRLPTGQTIRPRINIRFTKEGK